MRIKNSLIALVIILLCPCTSLSVFSQGTDDEKIIRVATQLSHWNPDNIQITRLCGGQTNDNYKVTSGSISCFFRCVNGSNAALGSSLEREFQITSLVSEARIAPKVIHYSPQEGVLVTDFIHTSTDKVNVRDVMTMQKFCHLIASVHNLQVEFPSEFCPFETIQQYTKNALDAEVVLPPTLKSSILPKMDRLQRFLLGLRALEKKPSHLDLHGGNIIDDGEKLWLIDWEYAAMADPYFDLATLASVEKFSDNEMYDLLYCYLGKKPAQGEFQYLYLMRILADTRWALWSYIQVKLSTQDEPFEEMGNEFLQSALERMNQFLLEAGEI